MSRPGQSLISKERAGQSKEGISSFTGESRKQLLLGEGTLANPTRLPQKWIGGERVLAGSWWKLSVYGLSCELLFTGNEGRESALS